MIFKKFLSLLFILTLTCSTVYATEPSSDQKAAIERLFISNDLTFSHSINSEGVAVLTVESPDFEFEMDPGETVSDLVAVLEAQEYAGLGVVESVIADLTIADLSASEWVTPVDASPTSQPAWTSIPIIAGDSDSVYMRVKTNKQIYAIGEIIYVTVYVSGLDADKDTEKEVLIRVEGHGITPVALKAETVDGTASGIVGVVASRTEAIKLDIIVEYGDSQTLYSSIPLTFNLAPEPTPSPLPNISPINIELIEGGKDDINLPKTSDISPSNYAIGCLTFLIMVICIAVVIQLIQKKKPSPRTISSIMYDRRRLYSGRMYIYSESERENLNEE